MSEIIETLESEMSLDGLLSGFGQTPLKTLIYGTAGAGKSVNAVSILPAYLASGYQVVYVFTENNAMNGFKEGLKIYWDCIKPFLKKDQLFIADLTQKILTKNRDNLGVVSSQEKSQLTMGAVYELCWFFTANPLVKDFTEGNAAKAVKFRNLTNLTDLTKDSKVLIVLDGYTAVDADVGGFAYWSQKKKAVQDNPAFFGGLRGSGTGVLQALLSGIQTDLVVLGHDKLQSVDLTDMLSGEAKEEQKERRALLEEQLQEASGFPALATSTTISKMLGLFSLVLHAEDTRMAAGNAKMERFIYSFAKENKWYARLPLSLSKLSKAYAKQKSCPEQLPQDWTKNLYLAYLLQENKLDGDNYEKLLTLTNQKSLL